MKPLLCIAVALSAAWLAYAAPQPLAFLNKTTVSDIGDLTATAVSSDLVSSNDKLGLTSQPTVNEMFSSTVSGEDIKEDSRSSSESISGREDIEITTLTNGDVTEKTTLASVSDAAVSTELKSTEPAEHVEEILRTTVAPEDSTTNIVKLNNESEISASRYVPPLDPMKHMLMMSDMKDIPKLEVKVTTEDLLPTTTETSKIEETEMKTEFASTESSEEVEKVIAESSEVEENLEPAVTDKTVRDINSSSTVIMKSEELSSVKDLDTETSVDSNSTSIISTSTEALDTTTDSTVEPAKEEETLPLHKNSELIASTEIVTSEKEMEVTENGSETTVAVFTSTEEAIKIDNATTVDSLLKNAGEITTEIPFADIETTFGTSPTEVSNTEVTSSVPSSSVENREILSTTSTTAIPETTFESSSVQPSTLASERKNISIEDELEFRSPKLPLNISKVEYAPEIPDDPAVVELNPESDQEAELTTANILTTITEILFSSFSTDAPDLPAKDDDEEKPTSLPEAERKSTDLPLPVEKFDLDAESDTGAILSNNPADMLKVQSDTDRLDSVPASDVSTEIPSTDTTVTENQTEASTTDEPEIDSREHLMENGQNEKLSETAVKSEVTFASTVEDTTTTTLQPSTEVPTTSPEPELENLDLKNSEISESEPEVQNDSPAEKKPSDYLSNIKDRYVSGDNKDMVAAVQFLHYHDKSSSEQCFKLVDAHWNYATNLTEENKKKQLEQTLEYSLFHKDAWKNATSFAWKSFNDTLLRRWFKSLSVLGTAALPEDKLNEFNRLKAEMKNTYSTAKICTYVPPEKVRKGQILREKDCNLTLEPDLQRILTKSRDYDELVHVWKSWRNAAGKPIREKYLRFVDLSNEAARMNGFADTGDMWKEAYESETFETDLEELWNQLKPLYENLHAYVRRRLIRQYGEDKIKADGPIPAHLFGNMWAQSWVSLLDITQPFPGKPSVDVTPIMEAKNMTAHQMFKISEEFFTSLGLKPMPEPFWRYSLIEKPKDREIICHASAWDFCNGRDYRIKQCTDITMEDLITVHHEMGHIQYFLQYARQPNVFREGANPGFHEAIGDVLALSVSTPKHLQSIGLLDDVADDPEGDLNFLLYTALDKVSFLPSGYLIDLWRWGLFSGDIKPEEMNSKWWDLRLKYQGVCPPVKRTDTDFDPGAKFHVPGNVPYIRYFVSFVIQFQFHKVLCDASGHTGPLYKCDIYRSKEAGQILSQVMELGSSEHWSEAMKIMTGGATNKMDAGPILEYFDPLLQFLKEQNQNETIGWRSNDATVCP